MNIILVCQLLILLSLFWSLNGKVIKKLNNDQIGNFNKCQLVNKHLFLQQPENNFYSYLHFYFQIILKPKKWTKIRLRHLKIFQTTLSFCLLIVALGRGLDKDWCPKKYIWVYERSTEYHSAFLLTVKKIFAQLMFISLTWEKTKYLVSKNWKS